MARARRILFAGAFYHVYNRGVEKRPIVFDDIDRRTFFHILADSVHEFQLRLFAYCLMDNHFHLFLQTPLPNLDEAMGVTQGQYARYINFHYERVGPLFQGRYKSRLVEADRYALTLVRYIHRNPIEAGIVTRMEEYPWSSYACYTGRLPKWKWLETDWLMQQFHPDPPTANELFQSFHRVTPPDQELKLLARFGRPLGEPKEPERVSGVPG